MGRPTDHINWITTDDATKIIDPGTSKKAAGWLKAERPAARFFNWLFNRIDKWLKFADASGPGAIVGASTGCTHASIAAAIADAALTTNVRVMVKDPVTVDSSPIVLSKDGWKFDFGQGATVIRGTSAIGLQVTGKRVEIRGARFTGFTTSGDKAIQFAAGSDYGRVMFCNFVSADTEVDETASTAGKAPLQIGNISE